MAAEPMEGAAKPGRSLADLALLLVAAVLAAVVLGLMAYSRMACPWVDHDTLENCHTIWLIRQGLKPYRDFFSHHMPMLYFILNGLVRGETARELIVSAQRWTGLVVLLQAAIWAAAFRLWSRAGVWSALWIFAVVAGYPTLASWTVHADTWGLLPETAGVVLWLWALWQAPPRRTTWAGLAAGFLIALAMAIQPKNLGTVAGIAVLTLAMRRWALAGWMIAGAVPVVAFNAWLVAAWDIWPDAPRWVWGFSNALGRWWLGGKKVALLLLAFVGLGASYDRRFRPLLALWIFAHIGSRYATWPNMPGGLYLALTAAGGAAGIDGLARRRWGLAPAIALALAAFYFITLGPALRHACTWPFNEVGPVISFDDIQRLEKICSGGTVLSILPVHPVTARDAFPFIWQGTTAMMLYKSPDHADALKLLNAMKRLDGQDGWPERPPAFIWWRWFSEDPRRKIPWLKLAIEYQLVRGVEWSFVEELVRREYRPMPIGGGIGYVHKSVWSRILPERGARGASGR